MSNNASTQLQRAKRDYELALDNATSRQSKLADLQNELMSIAANSNTAPGGMATDVEKARRKMDNEQKDLGKIQSKLEDIQKDFSKAQDKVNRAREEYSKLELKHRTGTDKSMKEQDKKRRKIESEIRREETDRKSWAIKAENARRDMEIWQKKMIDETSQRFSASMTTKQPANDNSAPRQNKLRA